MSRDVLNDKVLEWLKTTGFPLEMEAASAFRSAGFDVRQSSTFADPQSDKGREIDVLATDPDWVGIVEISFVVECKSSSKPWVVLTSEDALANYSSLFAFGVTSNAVREVLAKRFTNMGLLGPYIKRPQHGGYGFRQALGAKDAADPAYTAAMSALKACHGVAQDREGSSFPRFAFAFPVVVIDSPLFECGLNDQGELVLKEVTSSEFLFSAHIPEHVGCCVKVITKDYLETYASWAKELANTIRKEFKDKESRAFPSG